MFGHFVRPLISRVSRTFEAAGPVASSKSYQSLFSDPITHPEGDEVFTRLTRENVYPAVVEAALLEHPAVADVAVIGIPDEQWGETVKAMVVLREGESATDEELMEFCTGRLGGFQRPRSVDFIEAIPRNASGKVLKRELREPFWEGHERRVGGA